MARTTRLLGIFALLSFAFEARALVPFLDGGSKMPQLYDGWFNDQISKQASAAVSKAVSAGKLNIEVNFPPVPNVEEVKFGTPLNQRFGKDLLARDLGFKGGYKPGSDISRDLISFANIYWAKKLAGSLGGGMPIGGRPVCVLTSEEKWSKLKDISANGEKLLTVVDHKELLSDRVFLVYVARAYPPMVPYVKGFCLTTEM